MKRLVFIQIFLFSFIFLLNSKGRDIAIPVKLVDYTISYQWDILKGEWVKPVKNINIYGERNRVEMTVTVNLASMDTVSRTVYVFNETGRRTEYYTQNYSGGLWINVRKYSHIYDEAGRAQSQIVIDWKNEVLVYNRKQDYYYDETGKVGHMIYHGWNGSEWYETATEYYSYNEDGLLIGSESYDMNGVRINRWAYELNDYNKRTRRVVENWGQEGWFNGYQDLYFYDKCGDATSALRQVYRNNEWVNQSNVEYHWKFDLDRCCPKQLVAVCHKGHTLYVSKNAVKAHLAHGDCLGKCLETEYRRSSETSRISNLGNTELQVWPNPATDRISVKLKNNECTISRIEIVDIYGNRVKVMSTTGENEITVNRDNLHSGSYVMRVIADQTYSVIVIFK